MKKAHDGFTLAELLIVVAIIGILTAVSIPVFPLITEIGKERADNNYEIAARIAYLADYDDDDSIIQSVKYYDASEGYFSTSKSDIKNPYGQGTELGSNPESHVGMFLACTYSDGDVVTTWTNGALNADVENMSLQDVLDDTTINDVLSSTLTSKNWYINSGDTSNTAVKAINAYLLKEFPTANITTWRISLEGSVRIITFTDVDISNLAAGTIVKTIRYNSNTGYKTYTAGYVKIRTNTASDGTTYNELATESKMVSYYNDKTNGWWQEIGFISKNNSANVQNATTKGSYSSTVDIYSQYPDTKTAW